jgi:hypothetical protein
VVVSFWINGKVFPKSFVVTAVDKNGNFGGKDYTAGANDSEVLYQILVDAKDGTSGKQYKLSGESKTGK